MANSDQRGQNEGLRGHAKGTELAGVPGREPPPGPSLDPSQ